MEFNDSHRPLVTACHLLAVAYHRLLQVPYSLALQLVDNVAATDASVVLLKVLSASTLSLSASHCLSVNVEHPSLSVCL